MHEWLVLKDLFLTASGVEMMTTGVSSGVSIVSLCVHRIGIFGNF